MPHDFAEIGIVVEADDFLSLCRVQRLNSGLTSFEFGIGCTPPPAYIIKSVGLIQ